MGSPKSALALSRRLSVPWASKFMDTLVTPVVLLLSAIILLFAWLLWISRGGRPVRVNLEGLGIKLHIDANKPEGEVERKEST